jgi:hypothetical protein
MLRTEGKWDSAARRLLDMTLQRTGLLLLGVAAAQHIGTHEAWAAYPPAARVAALQAVALLGILLDAFRRDKEAYMSDTAFQLGRLLSLADTLHREYCLHVRKARIPPQLIGSALMPVAADNPEEAIDRLRMRISVYQAWATTSEVALAKWAIGKMGEICAAIKRPLPTAGHRTFRAELFLGYMARSHKKVPHTQEPIHDTGE